MNPFDIIPKDAKARKPKTDELTSEHLERYARQLLVIENLMETIKQADPKTAFERGMVQGMSFAIEKLKDAF